MSQSLPPRLADAEPKIRLGMRYGADVWALKPGSVYLERTGHVRTCTLRRAGQTPLVPSLKAAVQGVHESYGTELVMGTDPEFFLRKHGQLVPAFDFLPDKQSTSDGLFWDGFQAEMLVDLRKCDCTQARCLYCNGGLSNTVSCHAQLAQRIGKRMQALAKRDLQIAVQPVWRIPQDMLRLAGEAHVSLGCLPSWNAYGSLGRLVLDPRSLLWRFAGGHVHFQLGKEERSDARNVIYLVKTLDAVLGIPCVLLAQNYDHFVRRRYYGLAGEYRLPMHGLEYRTLSNFWLMHPQAFMLVFDLARHALNLGRARLKNIVCAPERSVRDTIDYCDIRSAKDFMRLNKEFYSAWAGMLYGTDAAFWTAIEAGVDKVIPDWGKDVCAAWKLSSDWREVPAWRQL